MKRPTMLLQRVLLDVGLQLSDTIDKDYREICSRYQKEGMSFLTITLPTLDEALIRGLTEGRLTRDMYTGFRSVSRRRRLPALLQGFFSRIFGDDGCVLDAPDVCAIIAIRQVTRLFKKVELPCSKPRIKAAYERYQSNDAEVDWRNRSRLLDSSLFGTICGILWSGLEVFSGELYCSPGIFGPGATAEKVKRNERFSIKEWPARCEGSFPLSYHALPREDCDTIRGIEILEEEEERPVRVVQVPKTLKTPRTISVEPSYMMLMQQSVAKPLMVYLESRSFGFQSIRFADQSVNKELARVGSMDGSLATIDLKDASDMVSNDLVKGIFGGPCPTFLQLIQDCRSTKAQMPDKTIIPLRKFASMGSALCFPIEAMVFFTIIMYALVKHSGRVPSRRLLQALAKDVAVYGDDIVVLSEMAPVVMTELEAFGLKVNHDKSFLTGPFRESCGGDYYKGVDVTPAYVRQWDDTGTLSMSSHLVAYVSLSNTFYMKGLWHACQYLREEVSKRVRAPIPLARHPIGCLHFTSFLRDSNVTWDSKLHGYRVKGLRVRSQRETDCPTNVAGFLGLAFQSRFFRERLQRLKDTVNMASRYTSVEEYLITPEPGSRAWLGQLGGVYGPSTVCGDESLLPTHLSELRKGDHRSPTNGNSVQNPWGSDGCLFRDQWWGIDSLHRSRSVWSRDTLLLKPIVSRSMYTSDRPHALCLKRGWTASQAGLQW